jgi:hypothetical protein
MFTYHTISKSILKITSFLKKRIFSRLCFCSLLFFSPFVFAADYLQGVGATINDNFGIGSTFYFIMLAVCVVLAIYKYVEVSNQHKSHLTAFKLPLMVAAFYHAAWGLFVTFS